VWGEEFNQKSHYTTHINKKNSCVVKEKLIEIKKTLLSNIINNIEIVSDNKFVKGNRTLIYVNQNKAFCQLIVIYHYFYKFILFARKFWKKTS